MTDFNTLTQRMIDQPPGSGAVTAAYVAVPNPSGSSTDWTLVGFFTEEPVAVTWMNAIVDGVELQYDPGEGGQQGGG